VYKILLYRFWSRAVFEFFLIYILGGASALAAAWALPSRWLSPAEAKASRDPSPHPGMKEGKASENLRAKIEAEVLRKIDESAMISDLCVSRHRPRR